MSYTIDPNIAPAGAPNGATITATAATNPTWFAFGSLTTAAQIKAALIPVLALLATDSPMPLTSAWNQPGQRGLYALGSVIAAISG